MENLCHLAYWLYIYGEHQLCIECIEPSYDVPFDLNYNVWTFIHAMCGLQVRLLRECGEADMAASIIRDIDAHLLTPGKLDTPERMPASKAKRRARFVYEDTIRQQRVEEALQENGLLRANDWRFIALLGMIGRRAARGLTCSVKSAGFGAEALTSGSGCTPTSIACRDYQYMSKIRI